MKKSEKEQSGHHRGGLLRLPPDAMTTSTPNPTPNVSNSSDWRSNRDFNHYDNNNPAWRGMESRPTAGPSSSNERYLFDPRNPKKPILAQRGGRGGGSSTGVPLEQHHQRYDYHSSSCDHDWRSGSEDQYRGGQVQPVKDQGSSTKSTSSKTIMPPR